MTATNIQSQSLPQTSLYVGDLHPLVTESLLYATFSAMGHVLSARVCRDVALHTSLGYGYVNFESPKDAERALENINYEDLLGRQIRIMWCQRDPSLRKSGRGNIFIKNLEKNIAQKDLYDTFCHFGKILSCKIAIDETGASKGYGFIHFLEEDCAKAAIEAVNGKMINDRIVFVGEFVPRSQRKSTGGKAKFTNCYVKNFSEDLTDQALGRLFEEFGEIKSACVMRDGSKSKGFGFVCFAKPESAEAAVQNMNGKELNGLLLYINRAQQKSERQEVLRQHFEKQRAERLSKYAAGINLYVKNLDDSIDDARLKEAFSQFGKITSARVMTDTVGHSKGFGFVCFTTPDEAKEAVNMNGTLLGSKPLYVALAQRKEDRRAKLFAEHQQRLQYRNNLSNMPAAHSMTNFFGQPSFPPTQRFFHPGPVLTSQQRWNRSGLGAPPVQLTHTAMGAANGLRPSMQPQYVANSNTMAAMTQNQLAQNNLVNSQYRNQAVARGMVSATIPPGMNPASLANAANMIAPGAGGPHQLYNTQRAMSQQMMSSGNASIQRPTMAAVTAGAIRPSVNSPMHRQIMQPGTPNVPSANVRFHQTARNVAPPPQPLRSNVPMRSGVGEQPFPININNLDSLSERDQKQYLGEQLFKKIQIINPDLAGKFTGMLIGMDSGDLLNMIKSEDFLKTKVQECMTILKQRDEVNSVEHEETTKETGETGDSPKNGQNESSKNERV